MSGQLRSAAIWRKLCSRILVVEGARGEAGMQITSRPFGGDSDLGRLNDFVVACIADGAYHSYWQVGDLLWGMYQNTVFDPFRHVRLWEDEGGELLGFAWFDSPSVSMQTHPRLRGDDRLEEQMLAWAEQHRRVSVEEGDPERLLLSSAFEDDRQRIAVLARHGFTRDDYHMLHMHQDLDGSIPAPTLPEGWAVRHVAGEAEFAERVATHREVWHPSKVTLEAYRRLRGVPGYTPELDLVAVAPGGTFASYCICWLDPANRHGEFEPVGTRPAFRRRGLGKAVMLEGLRRLKARGVRTAIVYSVGTNEASRRLYEAVGFRTVAVEYYYSKRL